MLDNFICYRSFFRRVKYCKVVNIGMCSDHTAILTSFKTTEIKFKVNEKVVAHIDWKIIGYYNMTHDLFKNSLSKSIAGGTTYSNYNKHILEAGTNTAIIGNQKNKGWSHFIRDSLLPLIEERNKLLYDYQTLGIGKGDSSEAKLRLNVAQLAVDDAIALEKAAWSAHQAEKYTQCASIIRKRGRVFVLSLEETQATTSLPPSCVCDYPTGNWQRLMQKISLYLAHTFKGY